jgi:hypothetical protein
MRRLFPILATVVGLLLMAGFYSGLIRRGDDLGRGVRLVSVTLALAVHALAFVYFWATGRRIEASARQAGLPGWVGAQAEKNWRKALHFQVFGSVVAITGVGLLAVDWFNPIVWGSSVSFQIGAFLGEAMIVANQSRLLEDLSHPALTSGTAEGP